MGWGEVAVSSNVIPRADWPRFIDAASEALHEAEVSIERHAGEVRREGWIALRGLSYDIAEDVVWIHTDAVEHEITGPRVLRSVEDGGKLDALEIEAEGARWVLRFRVPTPV